MYNLLNSVCISKEKSSVKIPIALYFYPIVSTLALILFWSICANYELSNAHQILLFVTSALMLFSTVILFIVYQDNDAFEAPKGFNHNNGKAILCNYKNPTVQKIGHGIMTAQKTAYQHQR